MHYKAPDNSAHFLDSSEFEHLLPAGSVLITDEEAEALRPVVDPQLEINAKAKAYLSETDWYVIRFADEGTLVPDDVKAKRAEARAAIV